MEASQELKEFIVNNKDLILSVEQDPDKANKLMSELEDATGSYGIDFYYETLNFFKELYGINEFISYINTFPVGFYRRGTFSTITIPKNIKTIISQSIAGCNIDKLIIASDNVDIRAYGIKNCNINTLTFNSNVQLYKNAIYECKIKSWNILNDLTIKSPLQTFRNYIREYKDCEFIVKNSAELVFKDINFSIDLVTYLEEDVEATNIKIV